MTKPEDPIRINEQEYEFDKLPPEAQRCVVAITSIDGTLNQLSDQMDLLQMARQGYINRLNATLETAEDKDNAVQ